MASKPENGDQSVEDMMSKYLGAGRIEGPAFNTMGTDGGMTMRKTDGTTQVVRPHEIIKVEDIKFVTPEQSTIDKVALVASGTTKQRIAAQKELIKQVDSGGVEDLLDVFNTALVGMEKIKEPKTLIWLADAIPINTPRTPEALGNLRRFVVDLSRALSLNCKTYIADASRRSTRAKFDAATSSFALLSRVIPESEIAKLPPNFLSLRAQIIGMDDVLQHSNTTRFSIAMTPEISTREEEELNTLIPAENVARIALGDEVKANLFNQHEIDLMFKASQSWHSKHTVPARRLVTLFDVTEQNVALLNGSLELSDPATRNCALRTILTHDPHDASFGPKLQFFSQLQSFIEASSTGDAEEISDELKAGIDKLVVNLSKGEFDQDLIMLIGSDYGALNKSLEDEGNFVFAPNYDFLNKLSESKVSRPAADIFLRMVKEFRTYSIDEDQLLELFDSRQSLGFFMDNLQESWQDLKKLTRERMYPSFIEGGSQFWPSDREIPTLEFIGKHPLAVLGFKDLQIFTRGYDRPEVGISFYFKDLQKALQGRIDAQGRLVNLPFDLEESHPHIHALLEHFAVGSLQELVTLASQRIHVRKVVETGDSDDLDKSKDPDDHSERRPYRVSLPRHKISYIDLDARPKRAITSEEMLELAGEREKVPVPIPQAVVPLPYALRFKHYRDQLIAEHAKGLLASEKEIKRLEGLMLESKSRIPNPSGLKLDTLPAEFKLDDKTIPGRIIETWRKDHSRPKLTPEEEKDLNAVYRRYRAAPVMLSRRIETWFTQPPTK